MSNIRLTDVLPALDGLEDAWKERLEPGSGLDGLNPREVPGECLVNEFVADGAVWPSAALHVAKLLGEELCISQAPLGSLLPDIVRAGPIHTTHYATPSLSRTLEDAGVTQWADLASSSPSTLFEKFGHDQATVLLACALREAAVQALQLARPSRRPSSGLDGAISTIATWARYELGINYLGAALDAAEADAFVPSEVRDAVENVRSLGLSEVADGDASAYDLAGALRRLLACDSRAALILEGRTYAQRTKLTLDELGTRLGVTRERVRQIETQLKKNINAGLHSPVSDVIKRAAYRLRDRIGLCCRLDELPNQATWALGIDVPPDAEAGLHSRVLLDLAGPYAVHESWLVREPISDVVARSAAEMDRRLGDALITVEEASAVLTDAGIPASEHQAWLDRVCECRVIDETVLPWRGSLADKADALLRLRGEPLTGEEISEALGPDTNYRSMINQIQADSRFLRRGLKLYGLSIWGGEEYTTIADELEQEIERQGGAASLDCLISTLCEQFGVSESSVRAYAASPPFVRTREGLITVGTGDLKYSRRPIEDCRGCFRVGPHWALRVVVDREILRGSGRPVPMGVPQHLGMRPGESQHVSTPVGDLMLRYSRQPTMGSVRRAALSLGCTEGDRLFVVFIGDAACDFVAVRAADVEALDGLERLVLEVGAKPGTDPVAAAAYALGLPSDEYRASAVRRRLVARREGELLPLIADVVDSEADDEVLSQLIGLGE